MFRLVISDEYLQDGQNMTPIHLLCSNSSAMDSAALETLLKAQADISTRDRVRKVCVYA